MAEDKKVKSEKKVKSAKTEKKAEKPVAKIDYASMTVPELRAELQKVILKIKVGEETNTSLAGIIKGQIARKLTKLNSETKA